MEKTMTAEEKLARQIIGLHIDGQYYTDKTSEDVITDAISLINQFKKDICRDVAAKAWQQATRKHLRPLEEKGFSAFIEEYLKSNP